MNNGSFSEPLGVPRRLLKAGDVETEHYRQLRRSNNGREEPQKRKPSLFILRDRARLPEVTSHAPFSSLSSKDEPPSHAAKKKHTCRSSVTMRAALSVFRLCRHRKAERDLTGAPDEAVSTGWLHLITVRGQNNQSRLIPTHAPSKDASFASPRIVANKDLAQARPFSGNSHPSANIPSAVRPAYAETPSANRCPHKACAISQRRVVSPSREETRHALKAWVSNGASYTHTPRKCYLRNSMKTSRTAAI